MSKKSNYNNTAIAVLFFYFISNLGKSQVLNLVPNSSFEITPTCNFNSTAPPPAPWYSPNSDILNSSSYFNACCSDPCCTVPFNNYSLTYQPAHSGQAYAGIIAYYQTTTLSNERQYIQTKLLDSLKANHFYIVSFYVNLQNYTYYAINNIGLLFTDTSIKTNLNININGLIPANPQIENLGNPIISDTLNWVKVSGVYKAKGGEKFITIGNFKNDSLTSTSISYNGPLQIYYLSGYYIDDVSVIDSALLPVLLSSYNIQQFNHQVINTWQTATEVNVSHFNIQRSSSGSGKDFETVGVVMAKGVGKYEWVDDSPPLSLGRGAGGEALFYRLETVDKDGERMYSDIKKISLTTNNLPLITIKPNPAKDYIIIKGKDMQQISIMDELGRLVKRIVPTASSTQIQVKDWAKGIYWIKATTKEGKTVTNKLVVGGE